MFRVRGTICAESVGLAQSLRLLRDSPIKFLRAGFPEASAMSFGGSRKAFSKSGKSQVKLTLIFNQILNNLAGEDEACDGGDEGARGGRGSACRTFLLGVFN